MDKEPVEGVPKGNASFVDSRNDLAVNIALGVVDFGLVAGSELEHEQGRAVEAEDLGAFVLVSVAARLSHQPRVLPEGYKVELRGSESVEPSQFLAKLPLCAGPKVARLPLVDSFGSGFRTNFRFAL